MSRSSTSQGYKGSPGCFFLIILLLALFVLHGLFIDAQAFVNQAKWLEKGSPNYTISLTNQSFGGFSGSLKIENGKVVDAHPPFYSDYKYYQDITVDGIFEQIRSHAFSPFGWETADYDPDYGYPKKVRFNQWSIATDPPVAVDVYDLALDPNH